jgi:hypothetical protein
MLSFDPCRRVQKDELSAAILNWTAEQVFSYNDRATKDNPLNDADRFVLAMSQISGKRLTYALIGKVPPSF